MLRIVADLGNSRMKWGRLDTAGRVADVAALAADDDRSWSTLWSRWHPDAGVPSAWAVSSVNPPLASRLAAWLEGQGVRDVVWYHSAAEVPVPHALATPEIAGADRALAAAAALGERTPGRPALVVLCGTAMTVERVDASGVWQGGAIAAGLGLTARALNLLTAQLPLVSPHGEPAPWGNSTVPALEAGVFWGVVGAARELLTRQSAGFDPPAEVLWTGGDAVVLARAVDWPGARVVPDLVLHGLARVAWEGTPRARE